MSKTTQICPKCNTENPVEANFCRYCGYAIYSEHNIYIEYQRLQNENDRLKKEYAKKHGYKLIINKRNT